MFAFLIAPPYGTDDCYITYRYAHNLFHHKQFVFNIGERVLGTTSPFYTLLLTVLQLFSDNIPQMSNFISCMCAALSGFFFFLVLRRDNLPLSIFCVFSVPFLLRDIGLETNFLMMLFAAAAYSFMEKRYYLCSAVMGLCLLTRQDSAVFISVMILMYRLKNKKLPWKESVLFGSIVVPWFVFSYYYFATIFPTSLQAKMGWVGFATYLCDAFVHLARYCDRYNFYFLSLLGRTLAPFLSPLLAASTDPAATGSTLLYLCLMLIGGIRYLKYARAHPAPAALWYLYPPLMIVVLSIIGPPTAHRWHLTPAVNFALIGQLHLFTTPLLSGLRKRYASKHKSRAASILIAGCCLYFIYFAFTNLTDFYKAAQEADRSIWLGARYHNYRQIGCFLKDTVADDESVFVQEVGTMGYYSMKRMIDGAGIISPGYGSYHRRGCWLLGMEREFPDYIVTWEMVIPFYDPVYQFENDFGKMVVYKKSNAFPPAGYPFAQLRHNFNQWKAARRKQYFDAMLSSSDPIL